MRLQYHKYTPTGTHARLLRDYYGATVGLLHGTGLAAIAHNPCDDYEIATPQNR